MSRTRVVIVKGNDPRHMSKQALGLLNAEDIFAPEDRVLIKPNCVIPKLPSTGITTDARLVEGIIDFVRACGVMDITIGEGGNPGTEKAFEVTGMRAVATRQNVPLVNLNKDDGVDITIPLGRSLRRVVVARRVLESTCIVNVPKLKIHHMAQVTLSMKNLMGAIVGDRGAIMHTHIDEKIVDLASLIRPKLNVIDGLVGAERDETHGSPVAMGLIIAGRDMVAGDAVGSAVMGLDPQTVRHVRLAADRGLGVGDLTAIDVRGEAIQAVRKPFSQDLSAEKLRQAYGLSDATISRQQLRRLWEQRS